MLLYTVIQIKGIAMNKFFVVFLSSLAIAQTASAAKVSLFNGKDLTGWEGDPKVWRVEDGVIAGGSLKGNPRNEFLATTRPYKDFDFACEYKLIGTEGFVNSGVQFRSVRMKKPANEMFGYQADIGAGTSGNLYDESRRKKNLVLAPKDLVMRIEKVGDWNHYRIRAQGRHMEIFLNGEKTVDYTEPDQSLTQEGLFGLQIHGGNKAVIYFRNITVEELPEANASVGQEESYQRLTSAIEPAPKLDRFVGGKLALRPSETLVFTGPENMVTEERTGWLELTLTNAFKDQHPRFRHMGWEGDTVYQQNRMMNWGSWETNLGAVGATTVVTWFGQMEALDSAHTPDDFAKAYGSFLDELSRRTPRIVVLSPTPFEKPADARVPDNTPKNLSVGQYAEIARKLAAERGLVFVDLFTPLSQRPADATLLTRDGIHFTSEGMFEVARVAAQQLGLGGPSPGDDAMRQGIVEKNRLWFDAWRCTNWAFAYGDRVTQPFAKGVDAHPAFVDELKQYQPLLGRADEVVQAMSLGQKAPAAVASAAPPRNDPPALSPGEEKSHFKIRDGYSVELCGDESNQIVRPVQMRFDERGRMWVLCIPSYPQLLPGTKANDYLLVCELKDGKIVKSSKFAEGLRQPMGFEFGSGGVYVCESTRLIFLRDTTGSGHADRRQVLLSGFGTGDMHQSINSIRWGADGALWFTQGYHIWSFVETPTGIVELNRSGIWRFNPRTLKLDSFLNDSGAGLNCWGVMFDDYGQLFHSSGADFTIWHTTPALIRTQHSLHLPTSFARSVGKCTEPDFLESSHLPDDMRGVLLKNTYYTGEISLYRLSDEGSSFKSQDLGDLISSRGKEFRPLETHVGPDGALYVCDWLNTVIGHYQASYRDPRRDLSHGRIWRVTANGRPLLERVPLETMDVKQLLAQLSSKERAVREHAQRMLYNLPADQVIPAADELLDKNDGKTPESAAILYHLSGIFAAHEEPRVQIIDRLTASGDFRWRAWGTHLIGLWADHLNDALPRLERAIGDEHPRVRLEAIVAASYVQDADVVGVALRCLDKPMDPGLQYALTQCIFALAPRWQPALAAGKLHLGNDPGALVMLLTTASASETNGIARRLIDSGKIDAASSEKLLIALADTGSDDDLRFVLSHSTSPAVLRRLVAAEKETHRRPAGDLSALVESMLKQKDSGARLSGFQLASAWQVASALPQARAAANNLALTADERCAAIEALASLGKFGARQDLIALTGSSPAAVRKAALSALAPLDTFTAATRTAALAHSIIQYDQVSGLLKPLLARVDGPNALAAAFRNDPPSATVGQLILRYLSATGRDNPSLLTALNAAAGIRVREFPYSSAMVAGYVTLAEKTGDAQRGQALFRESVCLGCHKLNNQGGMLGPDLSAVGRGMTHDLIVEAVLWPKRQVKEGYLLVNVTTKDKRQLAGYKMFETPDQLTLKDLTGGPPQVINKPDIATREDAGSIMPDGLCGAMSDEQIADLIRFLFELGK
jgi:putative heme-binding domain-containing protein